MREIRTSGSVGGRAGNRPVYPTTVTVTATAHGERRTDHERGPRENDTHTEVDRVPWTVFRDRDRDRGRDREPALK
jgi:hypothetical protein